MNALLLMLPGTPLTYYGEEIGMKDNYGNMKCMSDKRDPCRSPMQWNRQKNAGMTFVFTFLFFKSFRFLGRYQFHEFLIQLRQNSFRFLRII